MLRKIKKITKETPLIGRVINSFISDNPEENAPSIQAVIDNVAPPQNLLINGDFNFFQRGVDLSIKDLQGSAGVIYHADMWCTYNNDDSFRIIKQNVGARMICTARHTVSQRFVTPLKSGEKYTLQSYVNGELIKLDITGGTYVSPDTGNQNTSLFYRKISNGLEEIGIYLSSNFDGIVKYIRLNEGSIAYPHVEEDDAIALMRCQDYVYTFDLNFYTGFGNYNGGMIYIHLPNKVREMEDKPSVINLNNVTDFPIYYDGIREEVTITNIVLYNGHLRVALSSPIPGLIYKSVAFATSNFVILFSSEQS